MLARACIYVCMSACTKSDSAVSSDYNHAAGMSFHTNVCVLATSAQAISCACCCPQAGTVVMDTTFPSAYEQIMEKAKGLSVRTFALANAVVGNTVIGAPRA